MQTTSERRLQHSTRIAYGLPIALSHEGFHEPFEAECVDLSPGGLSLRSSCLPGVGETLTCHFDAPEAGQRVEVRGEVVWAHLEGHRGGEFGLRFLNVDATTIGLLSEMIAEGEARARRLHPADDTLNDAQLAVDGATDTFTARLLRRSPGLVTFEQDLSFLKLGRGVSAIQGDDVQRGEIASVAVRLDGTTPKLMVTLRYEPSEAPDDAHTRDEAVTALHVEPLVAKAPADVIANVIANDTVPDLAAPTRERETTSSGKHAVTLTEFDAAYQTRTEAVESTELPVMATRSEFDLPSALETADAQPQPAADALGDVFADDDGPALFTADDTVTAQAVTSNGEEARVESTTERVVQAVAATLDRADEDADADVDEDAQYEAAAARVLGERAATFAVEHDEQVSTVGRCDPAVMFKVDESDQDFRLPKAPSALTALASLLLSALGALRGFLLPLLAQLQTKLLPQLKARTEGLTKNFGPQAQALWTRASERSLPWLRTTLKTSLKSALHRTLDTAHSVTQRVTGRGQRRRTTGVPVAPTQTAATVNRRSQVAIAAEKSNVRLVLLASAAVVGLGLAGYALLSAPDPHVVPVHREINAAPVATPPAPAATELTTAASTSAIAVSAVPVIEPAVRPSAIELPATPTALPAPSYEAGRIAAPSYPTIERAAPVAPKPVAVASASEPVALQEATGAVAVESDVVTSNASETAKRFGASSVRGRHFTLQMSAPVKSLMGTADVGGFSVVIDGALSLDRAGPIAASHGAVARSMIINKGDRAELTIRFNDGVSPKYQVLAKGDVLEITIAE